MTFGNSGLGVFLALVLLTAVSGEESPCSSSCFSPSSYFKFNTTPLLARAVVGTLKFRAAVESVSGHAS